MDTNRLTTFVNIKEGPIFVTPCHDTIGMSVNIRGAFIQTFLTPSETTHLIAALTDALKVVEGGQP